MNDDQVPETATESGEVAHASHVPAAPDGELLEIGPRSSSDGGSDARAFVETWQQEVTRALGLSVAASTQKSYLRAVWLFLRFQRGPGSKVERVRVLVCGHSMVFWAGRHASSSHFGTHLGLGEVAHLQWMGRRGLRWHGMLPLLFRERRGPPPQLLVIHCGGNDLGLLKGKALILQVVHDLTLIQCSWPGVVIVWSGILPQLEWRCGGDPVALDRARRLANEIKRALEARLCHYLPHPQIVFQRPDLYRADGVHLSDLSNDVFLTDLHNCLN